MTLISFLVIQKETGIPVYTKDFTNEHDTQNIIFSGLMTVIQSVMKEMMMGSLKKISTEKYQVYGEEKEKFVLFLIGDIQRPTFIDEFMTYIGGYLDFVPMSDNLHILPQEVEDYLEESMKHLLKIYNRSDFLTGVFKFNETYGLEQLTETLSKEVQFFLTNYFTSLEPKIRTRTHIFYLITPDDDTLIGVSKRYNSTLLINCMIFKENAISIFASYKQVFIKHCVEFLNVHENEILNPDSDIFEIQLLAESLSSTLEAEFGQFVPSSDFIATNYLFGALQDDFIKAITTLMLGKPIAVLSNDEFIAQEVVNLLVFISGISDASFNVDSEIPKRVIWCPREYQSLFKELKYAFLDIDNGKLFDGIHSQHLHSKWEEILRNDEDYLQKINALNRECQSIWIECDSLILRKSKGVATKMLLEEIEKDRRELIEKILRWINPSFLSSDLLIIDENKVNW